MKLLFALFTLSLLLLLLFAGSIDGRKELGEYWKNAMKEQPMPEVIQDLVPANHQEDANPNDKSLFVDDLSQPIGVFAWIKNKPKEGRKEVGGYWKKMMKEKPMPENFQELVANIHQEDANPNDKNLFVDDLSQPYGVFAWIKNKPKEGRKEVGEYRKNAMKEQPMPEVIQDLVPANHQEDANPNDKSLFVDDLSQPYSVFAWIKNKPKEGRKEVGGYWKKMMKKEPMPEIFQELVANINQEDANPNDKNLFVDDLSQPYSVFAWIKNKPKEGRKEVGEYWKKMMKKEPMPEIFQELVANINQEDANPKDKNLFVDDVSQPYSVFAWIKNKPEEGRKDVGEYWKKMMKEEPMPEIFQELVANIHQEDANPNTKNFFFDDLSQPYSVFAWIKNKFGIKDNPIEKATAN